MGKTRYLFKKIRDTKGTFHAKMGSIKDRNSRDLTVCRSGSNSENWTWSNRLVPNRERGSQGLYI